MKTAIFGALLLIPALGACTTDYQEAMAPRLELPEFSNITGKATYRERIALPPGSVMIVQLLDVARQDVAATKVDEVRYDMTGKSVPVDFQLTKPNRDQNFVQLSVRAEIRAANGKLLFTTDTINPVMTRPVDQDLGTLVMVRSR